MNAPVRQKDEKNGGVKQHAEPRKANTQPVGLVIVCVYIRDNQQSVRLRSSHIIPPGSVLLMREANCSRAQTADVRQIDRIIDDSSTRRVCLVIPKLSGSVFYSVRLFSTR
jgi:hypothetical protein